MAVKFLTLVGIKKIFQTALQAFSGGEGLVATRADGFIDPSFFEGSEVLVIEASENLAARDAVNIFDDAGTFKVRKADASNFGTKADGFVTAAFLVTEQATVLREGKVGGFSGLIPGPIFLDDATAGGIVQTDPVTGASAGDIWQQLGTAINATTMAIEIGEAIELT